MKGEIALRHPTATPVLRNCTTGQSPLTSSNATVATLTGPASAIEVFNTTDQPITLSVASSFEYVIPPSAVSRIVPISIRKGAALLGKSASTTTSGYLGINFLG